MKKRKTNVAGSMILDCVCDQPKGITGSLGQFYFDKGKDDKTATQKLLGKDFHNHFEDGPDFHYNTLLNKYMVDYDIK